MKTGRPKEYSEETVSLTVRVPKSHRDNLLKIIRRYLSKVKNVK